MKKNRNHPFRDFRNFVYAVWKHLGLPDPTPVQYDIAYYLQYGPKRRGIGAYRGAGKSFLTSAYVVWRLFWNADLKIMVVSASSSRADDFSQFCLRLINDMPALHHMIPRSDQRRSLQKWDVNGAGVDHSPSVKSVGITGQLTGSRADIVIPDDIETPLNSMTQTQREKLEELVKEFDAVIKPLPTSEICYLGTYQCEESLYTKLPAKGYEFRLWPARKPNDAQTIRYEDRLAPYIVESALPAGAPVDPDRFTEEELTEREASWGRSGFALQFMLDPSLSDADRYPLRCRDLIVHDCDRDEAPVKVSWSSAEANADKRLECVGLSGDRWYRAASWSEQREPWAGAILAIDPSGRGNDETSYVVVKHLNGSLWLTRSGGLPGGYDEKTLAILANIAHAEGVNRVLIESNFGDGMFSSLFRPVLGKVHACPIDEVRNNKSKEQRIIDTLEPVMNQHRLIVTSSVVEADMRSKPKNQLFQQLTRMTRQRGALAHDDRIDVLAMAVAHWVERLDVDIDRGEERLKKRKWQEGIDRFLKHAIGKKRRKKNGLDRL